MLNVEAIAKTIAFYLSRSVEIAASAVIALALMKFIFSYVTSFTGKNEESNNARMRVAFGTSLALALELLLGADILITAVAPTWDDIGKLAAIAFIRTALNYFLEKELRQIDKRETTKESI